MPVQKLFRVVFIALLTSSSSALASTSIRPGDLPTDAPDGVQVIHQIQFPSKETHFVAAGLSYLYGDKFADSKGIYLQDRYLFTEDFGVEAHFARFSSSISDEEKAVRALGAQPLVYNPLWIARLGAVYQPIYGKFVIGSAIQHFKVGVRAGLHAALERVLQDAPTSSGRRTQVVYGPEVGSYLEFPVFKTTSFTLETDLLAHREIDVQSSPSGIRKIWTFALGVGFRL